MKMKEKMVSLFIAAVMVLTPTISVFAETANVGTMLSPDAYNGIEVAELGTATGIVLQANRYYYTIETKTTKSFSKYISSAQAATVNTLTVALYSVLGYVVGGFFSDAVAIIGSMCSDIASFYIPKPVKPGTYTGTASHVVKYKVDSLTGKRTKYLDGIRVTVSHAGYTYTSTKWYYK